MHKTCGTCSVIFTCSATVVLAGSGTASLNWERSLTKVKAARCPRMVSRNAPLQLKGFKRGSQAKLVFSQIKYSLRRQTLELLRTWLSCRQSLENAAQNLWKDMNLLCLLLAQWMIVQDKRVRLAWQYHTTYEHATQLKEFAVVCKLKGKEIEHTYIIWLEQGRY